MAEAMPDDPGTAFAAYLRSHPLGETPEWLNGLLAERELAPVVTGLILDGQRDNTLTSMAGTMRRRGFPPEAVLSALRVVNRDMVKPPLDDHDLHRIANSSKSWAPAAEATESSWLPKDIRAWLAGDRISLTPSYLIRSDGQPLLYRGRTHSFIGEPENGKSWLAQIAAAERLKAGQHVVYIDFESELDDVGGHLLALGVSEDQLAAQFHYVRLEVRMSKEAIADLVEMVADWAPEALTIDGVERGLAMWGKDSNTNKDVIDWEDRFVRPLAKATPGATVVIDHVTKNAATRGAYAVGAGAKLGGIDGASFSIELVPGTNNYFGKGKTGLARILLQKDSRGGGSLRGKQGVGKVIAFMRLTSNEDGDRVTYELQPPAPDVPGAPGTVGWRPTALMERISRLLEKSSVPLSQTAIESAVVGTAAYKRRALAALIEGEYVERSPGARGALLHRSVKTYRDLPADYEPGVPI